MHGAGVMALAVAFSALAAMPFAFASKPVAVTRTGCVVNGAFITEDGYTLRPRYTDGRVVDLRDLEGRKVVIEGALLPGDLIFIKEPPRDMGRCRTGGDPIGDLTATSVFNRSDRVNIGKSNKGKQACFFREEGSSHMLDIGLSADGAFVRLAYGDGPLPAESIPTPPLRVFAGKELTKTVDGDTKATGEYTPIQSYDGAVNYTPNLATKYGSGFSVVANADAKAFLEMVARARGEFIVVQSAARPENVDVVAIYDFKESTVTALMACAKKNFPESSLPVR